LELPNRNRSTITSIPRAIVLLEKFDRNFKILAYVDF